MGGESVLEILNLLREANIDVWLDGGWGVDTLVGKQTREHEDLDLVAALSRVNNIKQALRKKGFVVFEDDLPTRFVLKDRHSRQIDFHTVTFDEAGGGLQKLQDGRSFRYPPEGFAGRGVINGQAVKCLTPDVQARCHYGYKLDNNDKHDMKLLQEHFGIELIWPSQTDIGSL